jgi:SAM-dependent methyltransferase
MTDAVYKGISGTAYHEHRVKRRSDYAQRASSRIFLPYVSQATTVLDFGCGTGGILAGLPCARRMGVEINEHSAASARSRGIEVFESLGSVPSDCSDLAISHHALEHVPDPRSIVAGLRRVLKQDGRIVIVVPCEPPRRRYFRRWTPALDVHLFSWNPRSLGNLVRDCGFEVEHAGILPAGQSHYTRWLEGLPLLDSGSRWILAQALGRFHTMCVARPSFS